jgi:hypothetical protein
MITDIAKYDLNRKVSLDNNWRGQAKGGREQVTTLSGGNSPTKDTNMKLTWQELTARDATL